ncbi:hypothetical protein A2U01_0035059, partial [Trifolium medium]|nr:hypothetical protein [Trifolium medium]
VLNPPPLQQGLERSNAGYGHSSGQVRSVVFYKP